MTAKTEKLVRSLIDQAKALAPRTEALEAETAALKAEQAELEAKLRQVKGTREKVVAPGPYYVGDAGPTPELMMAVLSLLGEKPSTFQEIKSATGAGDNRIKGVIMRAQREGVRVVNLGTDTKAIWFCPTEEVWKRMLKQRKSGR